MGQTIGVIIALTVVTIAVLMVTSGSPGFIPPPGPGENIIAPIEQQPTSRRQPITPSSGGQSTTGGMTGGQTTAPPRQTATTSVEEIPDYLIPEGYTRAQLSPYFRKIRITSISRSTFGDRAQSFRLSASLVGDAEVNVTGWKIQTNRRNVVIPKAIGIYSPFTLAAEEDIVLGRTEFVAAYLEKGPLGKNFRLNKCTGYLQNTYDFNPQLLRQCPRISRSSYSHLSGECQTYISRLSACAMPDTQFYNSLPGTSEGNDCRAFLNTIGHGTCFREYSNDSDFLSNEWRVWIDASTGFDVFDGQHDRVRLFDKEGLLVDIYTY